MRCVGRAAALVRACAHKHARRTRNRSHHRPLSPLINPIVSAVDDMMPASRSGLLSTLQAGVWPREDMVNVCFVVDDQRDVVPVFKCEKMSGSMG